MYAELSLEHQMFKEVIEKNIDPVHQAAEYFLLSDLRSACLYHRDGTGTLSYGVGLIIARAGVH